VAAAVGVVVFVATAVIVGRMVGTGGMSVDGGEVAAAVAVTMGVVDMVGVTAGADVAVAADVGDAAGAGVDAGVAVTTMGVAVMTMGVAVITMGVAVTTSVGVATEVAVAVGGRIATTVCAFPPFALLGVAAGVAVAVRLRPCAETRIPMMIRQRMSAPPPMTSTHGLMRCRDVGSCPVGGGSCGGPVTISGSGLVGEESEGAGVTMSAAASRSVEDDS
jgi:hypothetical protein